MSLFWASHSFVAGAAFQSDSAASFPEFQLFAEHLSDFGSCPFPRLHGAVQVTLAVLRSMLAAKMAAALDFALDTREGYVLSHLPE